MMKHAIALVAVAGLCLLAVTTAVAQENTLRSFGSGFVVDPRGYILTNEHVVHLAQTVKVVYNRHETFPATVVSVDAQRDIALLKATAPSPLPALSLGSSTKVRRQDQVLVIGFPFGEDAVTSTSGRVVSIREENAQQILVTDAVVNPGNSGGPMLNDRGEVIGIIKSLLMAEVGGTTVKAGEIYAIPISFALPMMAAIPDYDWAAVGKATQKLDLTDIDDRDSPAVVQILSDRQEAPSLDTSASESQKAFQENALALVSSYLDKMELKYTTDTSRDYPVLDVPVAMDNASHSLRIVIDSKRQLVYLFLNRYVMAPEDHPRLNEILHRLMDLNWDLNVGKFERDKTDGEVRLSFTFTTENGVGFEAFEAIARTLLSTGDRLWPELAEMTGQKEPDANGGAANGGEAGGGAANGGEANGGDANGGGGDEGGGTGDDDWDQLMDELGVE
jgi:hypothetical protein